MVPRALAVALVAAGVSLASIGFAAAAQDVSGSVPAAMRYRYRLLGVYDRDTGDPIEVVEVSDVLSGTKTMTNKSGVISLFFLPEGGGIVRLRKLGYELQTLPVSISPSDTLPVTVVLARAQQLPTVIVKDSLSPISANLRGFEERAKAGRGGYFVDAKALRKAENENLGRTIPAHIPGLQAMNDRKSGTQTWIVSTRQVCNGLVFSCANKNAPSCFVSVFIDNARITGPVDFSALASRDFAGVEYYPGGASLPVKYNATDNGCGVLLLWTREK